MRRQQTIVPMESGEQISDDVNSIFIAKKISLVESVLKKALGGSQGLVHHHRDQRELTEVLNAVLENAIENGAKNERISQADFYQRHQSQLEHELSEFLKNQLRPASPGLGVQHSLHHSASAPAFQQSSNPLWNYPPQSGPSSMSPPAEGRARPIAPRTPITHATLAKEQFEKDHAQLANEFPHVESYVIWIAMQQIYAQPDTLNTSKAPNPFQFYRQAYLATREYLLGMPPCYDAGTTQRPDSAYSGPLSSSSSFSSPPPPYSETAAEGATERFYQDNFFPVPGGGGEASQPMLPVSGLERLSHEIVGFELQAKELEKEIEKLRSETDEIAARSDEPMIHTLHQRFKQEWELTENIEQLKRMLRVGRADSTAAAESHLA